MTDDPIIDLISAIVNVFDRVGITYAITGSVASSLHGEPCVSQDVDFVVRMTPDQAKQVATELPRRFYCSDEALIEAARECSFANIIDGDWGLKADISVLAPGDFHDQVLSRRRPAEFGPGAPKFYLVSPEDIILMKLVWRKDTRSEKQWQNALGVARTRGVRMDWDYLFHQAEALGVSDDLRKLRDEAGV